MPPLGLDRMPLLGIPMPLFYELGNLRLQLFPSFVLSYYSLMLSRFRRRLVEVPSQMLCRVLYRAMPTSGVLTKKGRLRARSS